MVKTTRCVPWPGWATATIERLCISPALVLFPHSRPCHLTLPQSWKEPKLGWKRTKKVFVYTVCIVSGPYKTVLKGRRLKQAELCFPSLLVLGSPLAPPVRPTAGALDPRRRPQLPITSSSSFNL